MRPTIFTSLMATAGTIYFFNPSAKNPPFAAVYATRVPGTNGLAFDRRGNLWTGDGTTGQGRVWKITSPGANCAASPPVNCEEVFRIQPMSNDLDRRRPADWVVWVRDRPHIAARDYGHRDRVTTRNPPTQVSQPLVANGLAFNKKGDLFNIDTARGAFWKVEFDRYGNLKSPTGCDTTFTAQHALSEQCLRRSSHS